MIALMTISTCDQSSLTALQSQSKNASRDVVENRSLQFKQTGQNRHRKKSSGTTNRKRNFTASGGGLMLCRKQLAGDQNMISCQCKHSVLYIPLFTHFALYFAYFDHF